MLDKCHIFIWHARFAGMCSGSLFGLCSGALVALFRYAHTRLESPVACSS